MTEELKKEIENIWKEIAEIKKQLNPSSREIQKNSENKVYSFQNKVSGHNDLLEGLLKSEYCHSKNGLTKEDIIEVFKSNGRPVVPKKITDLLAVWKMRKKIEAVKEDGNLRYFWINNDS